MTPKNLKIATWNLDHPKPNSWKKKPHIEAQIQRVDADIWILTETNNLAIDLSKNYHKFTTTEDFKKDSYTTIWVRSSFSGHLLNTFDSDIAVCVSLNLLSGNLLIYGTIITWHGDRGKDGQSKNWEEHYKSIQLHGDDWHRLLQENSGSGLLVAGDFNQSRDESNWYGTEKGRALLTEQLKRNHLVCLTDELKPMQRHNIDHICLSEDWAEISLVACWEGRTEDDIKLSDHNGVYVEITL
ncbi:MAG: endonuclease/exonuclease/phosphatase family protein [Thermosynechococcaceae cyanobacterium MS004]|nr:endonuclease/exonuclease/phosphatase family protein [Thermosynechococcaceae cyanobacterium MS004]